MPSFFYHIAIDLHQGFTPGDTKSAKEDNSARSQIFTVFNHGRSRAQNSIASSPIQGSRPTQESKKRLPEAKEKGCDTPRAEQDYRYGKLLTRGIKMAPSASTAAASLPLSNGHNGRASIDNSRSGLATKGRFEALEGSEEELGWGIVRLYRDGEETPGLYDDVGHGRNSRHAKHISSGTSHEQPSFEEEDCTTLCILAVPSYLTPSHFLGFVGEKTRDKVSHFRMIRTEKSNRYMVLMKFRSGKEARIWRKEWNGRSLDEVQVTTSFELVLLMLIS